MRSEQVLQDAITNRNIYLTAKVEMKERIRQEVERMMEESISSVKDAYELSVIRARNDGWSISKIAKAFDMTGTKFIYDILDEHTPEWRGPKLVDVERVMPTVTKAPAPEAPKNFRFKEDWAFIDLYFPGVGDVPGGYYTYRVEDRRDPHFETASVQTAIELEKIPGKGIDYWEANAYNAIVTIGKGQDYAEFKRVHMDPKGLTEDMIRAGWEKAND